MFAEYHIVSAQCLLPTASLGVCRRERWTAPALAGLAKRLFVGAQIELVWRYRHNATLFNWHGRVAQKHKNGWWIKHREEKAQYTFPPIDDSVFICRITATLRKYRAAPTFPDIPVGHRIRVQFLYEDCPNVIHAWMGTIAGKRTAYLLVKYDNDSRLFQFPPPAFCRVRIQSVSSFSRPHAGLRQQLLRFRRAAAAVASTAAALSPHCLCQREAFDSGVRSIDAVQERRGARRSINNGIRVASFNARTTTDRAKLVSLCGWMEKRSIDICGLQESKDSSVRNDHFCLDENVHEFL